MSDHLTREFPGYRYEIWAFGDLLYEIHLRSIVLSLDKDQVPDRDEMIEALRDDDAVNDAEAQS